MISIKDFAAERGKSQQAVYQQMKRKRNAEQLEGHVHIINGIRYLDDEAVVILDSAREDSPAVVMTENKDKRIEELEAANRLLLEDMHKLHQKYEQIVEWKADQVALIEQAKQDRLTVSNQIDTAVRQVEEQLQAKIVALETEKKVAEDLKYLTDQENKQLRDALETERNKTWLDKLFRK